MLSWAPGTDRPGDKRTWQRPAGTQGRRRAKGGVMLQKLTDQLAAELQRQAGEIDRLRYGEVIFKVQDGRLVKWDIKKSYRVEADSNKREAGA